MVIGAVAGCVSEPPVADLQKSANPTWSGTMRGLQENLSAIEEYVFDPKKFNDPANREFLGKHIQKLSKESTNLNHNPTLMHRDPTIRFVASKFGSDLQRAHESFEEGKIPFARYQLLKVTSSCVQCHTRMQQGPEIHWNKSEAFLKTIPPSNQVEFLIASRRFDQAYQVLEKNLVKETSGLNILDLENLASLGLMVTVQYQNSSKNSLKLIDAIQNNAGISPAFKKQAQDWRYSVIKWQGEKKKASSMLEWRRIFENRKNQVDAMRVIPGVLELISVGRDNQDAGEGLLLLGESYEVLNEILPMDLHENYYEACIQSSPHTKTAKKCYSKLLSSVTVGYTGSSGTRVPVDVEVWLEKLRKSAE